MNGFKKGDRVRHTGSNLARDEAAYRGALGTVTEVDRTWSPWLYKVEFDGLDEPGDGLPVHGSEIEAAPNIEVAEFATEVLYYQPWPDSEWVVTYPDMVDRLREEGKPVKRVKTTRRYETEYLA
jgi:hypothetical protein